MSILNLADSDQPVSYDHFRLIQHLQKMIAFQSLAMEKVNDAFDEAAGSAPFGNEVRPKAAALNNKEAVRRLIVPALKQKEEILRMIEKQQDAFGLPAEDIFRDAFVKLNTAVDLMRFRTSVQIEEFEHWLDGRIDNVDVTQLTNEETEDMDMALISLNYCLQILGFDFDGFLEILEEAINDVRASIGLNAIPRTDFRSMYLSGLDGKPARFFAS